MSPPLIQILDSPLAMGVSALLDNAVAGLPLELSIRVTLVWPLARSACLARSLSDLLRDG